MTGRELYPGARSELAPGGLMRHRSDGRSSPIKTPEVPARSGCVQAWQLTALHSDRPERERRTTLQNRLRAVLLLFIRRRTR